MALHISGLNAKPKKTQQPNFHLPVHAVYKVLCIKKKQKMKFFLSFLEQREASFRVTYLQYLAQM